MSMLQRSKFLNKADKLGKLFPCPDCKTGVTVLTDCEFMTELSGAVWQKTHWQCRQCGEKNTSNNCITTPKTKEFTVEDVKLYVQYK